MLSEKCYIIECKFKEIAQNGIDFYGINDVFWPNCHFRHFMPLAPPSTNLVYYYQSLSSTLTP